MVYRWFVTSELWRRRPEAHAVPRDRPKAQPPESAQPLPDTHMDCQVPLHSHVLLPAAEVLVTLRRWSEHERCCLALRDSVIARGRENTLTIVNPAFQPLISA